VGLTPFQDTVARLFFSLKESRGYLLHGGSALLAFGMIDRSTKDLDFFTDERSVAVARDALLGAVRARTGWSYSVRRDYDTFCSVLIEDGDGGSAVVDLAVDSPAIDAPSVTSIGPAPAPLELAGRKLLALFGRAESRDFADVFLLARRYGKAAIMAKAAEIDRGFDKGVLAQMLRSLARFDDDLIPQTGVSAQEVRDFFAEWDKELQ
jgi:hypothetical protein